jgi:hypothetical protein
MEQRTPRRHGGMEIFGIEKRKIGDYELLVWITTV